MRKVKLFLVIVTFVVIASSCAKKVPADKIVVIEKSFSKLQVELQAICVGSSVEYQQLIMIPFKYVEENSNYRNRDILISDVSSGQSLNAIFRYKFRKQGELQKINVLASFNPGLRTLTLDENFEEDNLFSLIVLGHEVMHCVWDNSMRSDLSPEKYAKSIQLPKFIDLKSEMTAYLWEIEVINLITRDSLRNVIESGRSYDVDKLANQLELSKDNCLYNALPTIIDLAISYYSQDQNCYMESVASLVKAYSGVPYVKINDTYVPY